MGRLMGRDRELESGLVSGLMSVFGISTKLESESRSSSVREEGGDSRDLVDWNRPPASLEIVLRVVVVFKKKVEATQGGSDTLETGE